MNSPGSLASLLSMVNLGGGLSRNPGIESFRSPEAMMQRLKAQQDNIRYAQRFKGQKPKSRPSRHERLSRFNLLYGKSQAQATQLGSFKTSVISHIYPPSVASIKDLQPISIKDLVLETNHRGKYLLLRTITPPDKMTSVCVIVEDVDGVTELLIVYNCVDEAQVKFLKEFLPKWSMIVLKEPYFKMSSDGSACLRVDHLSDIVFLEQSEKKDGVFSFTWRNWDGSKPEKDMKTEIKIPMQWKRKKWDDEKNLEVLKEEGNKCFKEGNFHGALRCYTRGLQLHSKLNHDSSPSEIVSKLRLNRIQALLLAGYHEKALAESEYFLSNVSKSNEKALYRGARALYLLRRFGECKTWLADRFLAQLPESNDAKTIFVAVEQRLEEQQRGRYDFAKLIRVVKRKGVDAAAELEVADYQSPAIELREIEKMGRGMVATRNIEPGELLLVSKAWMIGYSDKAGFSMLMNLQTNETALGAQAAVTEMAIAKAWKCPELARKELLGLWCGTYKRVEAEKSEADGNPVIDSYLVDRIRCLNAFGCGLLSSQNILPDFSSRYNRDNEWGIATAMNTEGHELEKKEGSGNNVGIWITPSYINHSCQGNCTRTFVGDVMIVRASARISKGEQLTWGYVHVSQLLDKPNNLEERRKNLEGHWGFKCICHRCVTEATDKSVIRTRRHQLYVKMKSLASTTMRLESGVDPRDWRAVMELHSRVSRRGNPEIEKMVKDLENSYPASRPATVFPRVELGFGLMELVNANARFGISQEVCTMSRELLRALGWVVEYPPEMGENMSGVKREVVVRNWGMCYHTLVAVWVHLWWDSVLRFEKEDVVEGYKVIAKKVFVIVAGCDEGFEEVFGKGLEELQKSSAASWARDGRISEIEDT